MKNLIYLFLTSITLLLIGCKSQYPDLEPGIYADLQTDKGNILLQLAVEETPGTVANFVALSEGNHPMVSEEFKNKPYYEGIIFHRVIADFMIQAGDPTGTGSGGPGYTFDDEITALKHDGPGVLSMANRGPATNGSQFFITHKATPWLDGKHTVFGKVVKGQEVVDSVQQMDAINKMEIIRVGKEAKAFDAPKAFEEFLAGAEERKRLAEEKRQAISATSLVKFNAQKEKAKTTKSGLQYIVTKKGNGPRVTKTNKALTHYAVYFASGELLETSKLETAEALDVVNTARKNAGQYLPIPADCSPNAQMIEGFKEGLRLLRVGDQATLFLPYNLAYGENGNSGIPPRSDLIFEVEIVELIE